MTLPQASPLREIGKTGVKISAIGYGGMSLAPGIYGETDDGSSVDLLKKALDIGCNFWDTMFMVRATVKKSFLESLKIGVRMYS
ncbi:hypothetical protein K450DRAFT_256430 [Umbelopsis ramanniana AG]|uniref:NADP-dependent oxidoreductase domain-containing protein n=1 Tax=Umbelopsis ramanniana AG TaxID=1314678 RepID=A0AAD5HB58_UMBRA|nr:uncharacterized protein K450DRAFT_256430 [Umbelopsis ramanniana AG]KAI8576494.1 hypothetical protein K450DRAFT_256430 [Umbelopsis ramanniana AG]